MSKVEGSYVFKNGKKFKGRFELQAKLPKVKKKNWKPITWTGNINDKDVEIVQLCHDPTTIEDFSWDTFPAKYNMVKAYIAYAIESHLEKRD